MEEEKNLFVYMASLIHNGKYNYGIKWKDFYAIFSSLSNADPKKICSELLDEGYVESVDDDDPFMLISKIKVDALDSTINRLFSIIKSDKAALNIALCYSIEPSFIQSVISATYYYKGTTRKSAAAKVLIPICTSDEFQNDERVIGLIRNEISDLSFDVNRIKPLLKSRWFLDLLFILRNGKYGNGGFDYIEDMSTANRDRFINGIISILDNGLLVTVILRLSKILAMDGVGEALEKYSHRNRRSEHVSRIYYYLSIANDILVGLEFLTGSFEFLPGGNEVLGVYLFIIGSSELLIRPFIEIAKRVHLHIINRAKTSIE